jgi:hypothetical protein
MWSELRDRWPETLWVLLSEEDGRADERRSIDKAAGLASVGTARSIAGISFAWKSMSRSVEVSARIMGMGILIDICGRRYAHQNINRCNWPSAC